MSSSPFRSIPTVCANAATTRAPFSPRTSRGASTAASPPPRPLDTEHQARLSGDARQNNLHNAFSVVRPPWVRGRTVLLVDDVMTTGTTLSQCAAPLVKAGAARVWCATLARSVRRSDA